MSETIQQPVRLPSAGGIHWDRDDYVTLRMGTPVRHPEAVEDVIAMMPGTAVKERGADITDMWCGIVAVNNPVCVIVIGHGWSTEKNETFIWIGTQEATKTVWEVD